MNLDLSDDEAAALTQELHDIVENDRYPFSPRIRTLRAILDEMQKAKARQLRRELQRLILPILATHADSTVSCVGTGFLIVANGRRALMVTAAHVVDMVRKIDDPFPVHHPTTPEFFRPEIHRFELHKTRPCAMYYHTGSEAHKALIEAFIEMPKQIWLCAA